ncbi:MAG: hypothetical protein Kow0059_01080 [Candidatus Sumerlaeia bacterium]
MGGHSKRRFVWAALAAAGLAALAAGSVWLMDYVRYQQWLLEDAQTLQPYRHILFDAGHPLPLVPPSNHAGNAEQWRSMARTILDHNQNQNILLTHLSMGDPRWNFFHTRAFVKVYIETRVAGVPPSQSSDLPDERRTRRLKAVYTLAPRNDSWRLLKTTDRTIE